MLQAGPRLRVGTPFPVPPAHIELLCQSAFPAELYVAKHFVPARASAQIRGTKFLETRPSVSAGRRHVIAVCGDGSLAPKATVLVCGVVGIRTSPLSFHQGFVLVWGQNNLANNKKGDPRLEGRGAWKEQGTWRLPDAWWAEDKGGWYTAIHPWMDESGSIALRQEMSDFESVQRLLDRCCDEVPHSTAATDLVCHPDGRCERSWLIREGEDAMRVAGKATITPIVFLDRTVMKIVVEADMEHGSGTSGLGTISDSKGP